MTFDGWPEQAFEVLLQLDGDPPMEVRKRVRKDRERLVRQPMVDLMHELAMADETYEDSAVWHYGKTAWWWQHQCGTVRIARNVELGIRFDLDGLELRGGWGWVSSEQVKRFRNAVAADGTGPELEALLDDLRGKDFEITGDLMKRVPRGFPADHPRATLLRHRSLFAARPLGCDDWLHKPEVVDRVLTTYGDLKPLMFWLARHVSQS